MLSPRPRRSPAPASTTPRRQPQHGGKRTTNFRHARRDKLPIWSDPQITLRVCSQAAPPRKPAEAATSTGVPTPAATGGPTPTALADPIAIEALDGLAAAPEYGQSGYEKADFDHDRAYLCDSAGTVPYTGVAYTPATCDVDHIGPCRYLDIAEGRPPRTWFQAGRTASRSTARPFGSSGRHRRGRRGAPYGMCAARRGERGGVVSGR